MVLKGYFYMGASLCRMCESSTFVAKAGFGIWMPHMSFFSVLLLLLSHFSRVRLWPHRRQPTRLRHPWDSPGKNTGVGCHFLLQCMKVKSESEVAQSCPIFSDPMDCSLPGSYIHGIFQARVLEWGANCLLRSSEWAGCYPLDKDMISVVCPEPVPHLKCGLLSAPWSEVSPPVEVETLKVTFTFNQAHCPWVCALLQRRWSLKQVRPVLSQWIYAPSMHMPAVLPRNSSKLHPFLCLS